MNKIQVPLLRLQIIKILAIFILGFVTQDSFGLDCMPRTPSEDYKVSDVVILGEVISKTILNKDKKSEEIIFDVQKVIKGSYKEKEITINLNTGWDAFLGKKGDQYLFFANKCKDKENTFCLSVCRTIVSDRKRIDWYMDEIAKIEESLNLSEEKQIEIINRGRNLISEKKYSEAIKLLEKHSFSGITDCKRLLELSNAKKLKGDIRGSLKTTEYADHTCNGFNSVKEDIPFNKAR